MPPRQFTLPQLTQAIVARRLQLDPSRALLVGVSGIDGAGKGWVTARLSAELERAAGHTVTLNVDSWLNLPAVRFGSDRSGEHFYRNALRLDSFVRQLLQPLQSHRAVDVTADVAEETATSFRPHRYRFDRVDVILAEGIFLFKREYRSQFDLAIWIDCTFETALERALARAQEGLSPQETIRTYLDIYFPAQAVHTTLDAPRDGVDGVLSNDPRLGD